ncbi:MAG: starch-binding protein [Ruminococcus sp.]|nr:starch-binding protein [Ruminococcus sp.]
MKSSTRLLSLVLAMLMLFSVFTVAASAREIEVAQTGVTMTGGEVLYLKPNSNWTKDGARFACYFFGTGNTFASMTKCENDPGYYKVTVPSGSWTNVIFCRMNGSNTTNNWNNKWNQTGDLTYDGTKNLFTVPDGAWDGSTSGWSVWSETPVETEPESTEPEATEPDATEPDATEPEATEPEATEPEATEPEETEPPVSKTAYFINSAKWDAVSAYAWIDGGAAMSWPGTPMTKTEDTVNGFDVYEITVDVDYQNIIFNNNDNGSKTDDLTFMDGQYYDLKTTTWYASLDEVPAVDTLATDRYLVGSFNGWSTSKNEFKLNAEGERTGYVTLTLEAETDYEFKVVREGAWTSCATPITGTVEGLTFSSSVGGNATLKTTVAGEYVFSFGLDNSQLSVTYPEPEETEPEATEPEATEPEATEPEATEPEATEPEETEPEATEPEETEPVVVAEAGYYLVGTLNGQDCWTVDENSADRMLVANEGAQGEYMLDYTFVEGDEIKVVYFDGTANAKWYNDGGDNYGIGAVKAGEGTLYFRPDGNDAWSYYYFTVVPKEVPTESSEEESSDDPATDDQPTIPSEESTEESTEPSEDDTEYMTIYFQNNWLWSDVKAYFWGSASANSGEYPGDAMKLYDNDGTYDVYMVKVPTDIEGIIFNGIKDDGTGTLDKTPDIKEGFYDGICYYMMWDNGNTTGSMDIKDLFPDEIPSEDVSEEESTEEPSINKVDKVDGVKPVDATRDSFTISWDAVEDVAYYWVYVDGIVYDKTTDTQITVTGRKVDTEYKVIVRASYADDTITPMDEATEVSVRTNSYVYSSSAEANADSITISWEAVDSTKTWIYYGKNADDLKIYGSSTSNEFTIPGLESNTTYYCKLAHYIDDRLVDTQEVFEVKTAVDEALLVDAVATEDGMTLSWNAVDTVKYWVFVETPDGTITYGTTDTTLTLDGFAADEYTITVKGATAEGKMVYYYPVEA